jgi:hypothetical protein
MASSAEGNISKALFSEGVRYDGGLTPDDAERFAAAFKPSWEVEEAPYAASTTEPRELEMVGMPPSARAAAALENGHAHAVSAHAPAGRIATHEPDVSVIIDASPPPRSVPAPVPATSRPPPPAFASGAPVPTFHPPPPPPAPQFAQHPQHPGFVSPVSGGGGGVLRPSRPAPVTAASAGITSSASTLAKTVPPARYTAADSAEFPVKKSSKPLFIGIGIAVALAALVLGVRAATSTSPDVASPAVTTTASHDEPSIPAPPDTPTARPIPVVTPGSLPRAGTSPVTARPPVLSPPSQPVTGAQGHAAVLAPPAAAPRAATPPAPAPRAVVAPSPVRAPRPSPAPAPKSPPKPASGGIVRDVPF